MPTARRCAGCGATLRDPEPGRSTITCSFCGLTHDLASGSGPRAIVIEVGPEARRTSRTIAYVVLGVVALALAMAGWVTYEAMRRTSAAVSRVTSTLPHQTRGLTTKTSLTLDDLATTIERGWKPLETPPPPGGGDAFEPVAALPWAMTIARAWASDAALTRVDVGRVSATGVVDLSGESTSGYRFTSRARQQRWTQEADAGSKGVTTTGMMLQVQGDTVRVLVEEGRARQEAPPPAPAAMLPLPELLERARTGRGFQDRPFYSGYLIHLPREGWVWYFRSPSGDSFPRVRARDGRPHPY